MPTDPTTTAARYVGEAWGAPRSEGVARIHILRPGSRDSAFCGVVLRRRWLVGSIYAREPTCRVCVRRCNALRQQSEGEVSRGTADVGS